MPADNSPMLTSLAPPDVTRAVRRLRDTPIVEPGAVPGYGAIFNAGLLHHDGRFHLFARGVREGYRRNHGQGPRFLDYLSDIVVLESADGHQYEYRYTLAAAGEHGVHCFEDPRVQVVSETGGLHLVMTYTNLPPEGSGLPWRIGAHLLRYDGARFHLDAGSGRLLGPDGVPNKDALVFALDGGRAVLMHRVHPNIQVAVFNSFDELWHAGDPYWSDHMADLEAHTVIRPAPGALGVGAGAPPVTTAAGLLLFFHERRADGAYTMNVALLDRTTARLAAVLEEPVLAPELHWERRGDVDEVVFVQGAHLCDDADTIYLVYGAADRCVGAATASVAHLVELLGSPAARAAVARHAR